MRTIFVLPIGAVIALILYKIAAMINTSFRNRREAKRLGCKQPPTFPSPDPLGIANVMKLIKAADANKLPEFFRSRNNLLTEQEGRPIFTFQTHIARNWLFFTCDPKNIQAILATQFKDFELGPIRFGTFSPLLGHGIFSADGKRWEHSRALLRPQFAREQVSDLELEERHLQNFMKHLPVKSDGWTETTDLLPLYFRLTIDSASEFLFGESTDTQLAALPGYELKGSNATDNANFVKAFESSQEHIAYAFRLNDWFSLALGKEFYDACKICHQYLDRFVQRALQHDNEKYIESGEKHKYFFLEGLAAETKDPIEIRDQLLSILVAGRDTTASLLSFLFLRLSKHPEIFQKLRTAILNDFGTGTNKLSFSNLKACSYLQWTMNEILRLYPTVPGNSRRSIVDTTLPRGGGPDGQSPIFVPKGTEVNYSVYVMHRNEAIWGDDSDEFKPERWSGRKPGFEYLPFNGGPRICLGQQFALTEAGYVIVRMLQRFDKLDGSAMAGLDDDWYLTLTGRPAYGVKLRLHEASS